MDFIVFVIIFLIPLFPILWFVIREKQYAELEGNILRELGFQNWDVVSYIDAKVTVKSRQALEKYDDIKFFKENEYRLSQAENVLQQKNDVRKKLSTFYEKNIYKENPLYYRIEKNINKVLENASAYRIHVEYVSYAGNHLGQKNVSISQSRIDKIKNDPSLIMSKSEYNKLVKEKQKEQLNQKHHDYYDKVNHIIEYANENKDSLIIKNSQQQLDNLIAQLFDRTVNSIKKIKTLDSDEWSFIDDFINNINCEITKIIRENRMILMYYDSSDFLEIKKSCDALMSTQREFNEYINEKVKSISSLFGVRVIRNETISNDKYNYIRPYKKTITPFTAEVSSAVFSSAENHPLEYIIKYFYPDKTIYPKQIQKLQMLIEELETLKEAKQIINIHKKEYDQYIVNVPDYVIKNDEDGFYSRLGFAHIDESVLTVEYKFVYTSDGGFAQRYFTVPMTEENIIELINALENKLSIDTFAKEQRVLMTKKLRESIKSRDNYTCCICGNSIFVEPNLLLEVDHIVPVSKGGLTKECNLQTLCWKCNRSKSNKLI